MSKGQSTNQLWHDRLGHLNRIGMDLLKKGVADRLSFSGEKDGQCIACLEARINRTLVEKARCMMKNAGSDEKMWAKAVITTAYLANWSPHKATGVNIPEEWWCGRTVNLAHLHVFCCIAYSHTEKQR
ncbi:hypothetical protein PR048_021972 [Dryococelus australis]|uniref:GAG-pre-integrase domain-containing protein n=1 Tax=Dryococelus australis TaxID=614101 RepID=A0ABQ9GZQ3_9NEOP|nr:hypothetical protein PR048_021972 [Dryococelus australis]